MNTERNIKVAPSILGVDFLDLGGCVRMLNGNADIIHLDIMDGSFVPNLSFGFPVIDSISKAASVPMDAHLMVVSPERWFGRLAGEGVQMVSFHLEAAARKTSSNIDAIHELGMKAGVAVNPDIPVSRLYPYIGKADFFLLMSVFAGFGGQKFIYETLDKVGALKAEIRKRGAQALIEVDGGIGPSIAGPLREAGADIIVAGSSVFNAEDPAAAIAAIREA